MKEILISLLFKDVTKWWYCKCLNPYIYALKLLSHHHLLLLFLLLFCFRFFLPVPSRVGLVKPKPCATCKYAVLTYFSSSFFLHSGVGIGGFELGQYVTSLVYLLLFLITTRNFTSDGILNTKTPVSNLVSIIRKCHVTFSLCWWICCSF